MVTALIIILCILSLFCAFKWIKWKIAALLATAHIVLAGISFSDEDMTKAKKFVIDDMTGKHDRRAKEAWAAFKSAR